MPISKDSFGKLNPVGPTLEEAILDFLKRNSQSAYTDKEIAMALDPNMLIRDPNAFAVNSRLESLVARKLVAARLDQSQPVPIVYYTAN